MTIWGIWPCASLKDQAPIQEWLNSFVTGYTCTCTRLVKPVLNRGLEEQPLANLTGVIVEGTSLMTPHPQLQPLKIQSRFSCAGSHFGVSKQKYAHQCFKANILGCELGQLRSRYTSGSVTSTAEVLIPGREVTRKT